MRATRLLFDHQWSMPLTRIQRLLMTLIITAAVAAGAVSCVFVVRSGDPNGVLLLITVLVLAWSYASSGLLLGLVLGAGTTVILLLGISAAWLIRALTLVDGPAASIAIAVHPLILALLVHLLATFPGWRAVARLDRVLIVANVAVLPLLIIDSFFNPSGRTDPCLICLPNATAHPPLSVLSTFARVCVVAVAVLLVVSLWRRRVRVGGALVPTLVIGMVLAGQVAVAAVVPMFDQSPGTTWVALNAIGVVTEVLLPLAMLVSMARALLSGTAVREREAVELAAVSKEQARTEIERNLHDGAQLRLLSVAIRLKVARSKLAGGDADLEDHLNQAADDLGQALQELRQLARGEQPSALERLDLRGALAELGAASPFAVTIEGRPVDVPPRVAEAVYFTVAEALSNAARHGHARTVLVAMTDETGPGRPRALRVEITDDGVGGADVDSGRGLTRLSQRVMEIGGTLDVSSRAGVGTSVVAVIPCASSLQTTPR